MAKRNAHTKTYDYLVIGAGPAGLQIGYFLKRAGRSHLILEAGEGPGTFFKSFPRHRKLISINKVNTGYDDPEINLRWDWNSLLGDGVGISFRQYSQEYFPLADMMVDYLCGYAAAHQLDVRYGARVVTVEQDDGFRVVDSDGRSYRARRLVVASGLAKPYVPPIPGIDEVENYCGVSVDPADFRNQRVLIIGKGNSAFETADNLTSSAAVIHVASPNPIKMAWKTHHVGHLRALNNDFLDTYQLKSQNAVLDCTITQIQRVNGQFSVSIDYTHADEEAEALLYDRVICCTGFRFDSSIFGESCRPELEIDDRFPALTSAWESRNVPGLYFAGTLMQMRDFKKYTSAFIHGFRYNIRSLHRILEERYHGNALAYRAVDCGEVTEAVIARVNASSALWQQFSMLCDLVVVDKDEGRARYYEELPIDYVHDSDFGRLGDYYTISLEFGKSQEDPFSVKRHPDPERGHESFFLHPVVRHFEGPELLGEHHLLEDLYGEWKKPAVHVEPLRQFFSKEGCGG